jgi:hypothetical protein
MYYFYYYGHEEFWVVRLNISHCNNYAGYTLLHYSNNRWYYCKFYKNIALNHVVVVISLSKFHHYVCRIIFKYCYFYIMFSC